MFLQLGTPTIVQDVPIRKGRPFWKGPWVPAIFEFSVILLSRMEMAIFHFQTSTWNSSSPVQIWCVWTYGFQLHPRVHRFIIISPYYMAMNHGYTSIAYFSGTPKSSYSHSILIISAFYIFFFAKVAKVRVFSIPQSSKVFFCWKVRRTSFDDFPIETSKSGRDLWRLGGEVLILEKSHCLIINALLMIISHSWYLMMY